MNQTSISCINQREDITNLQALHSCRSFRSKVSDYLDNELSESDRNFCNEHAASCSTCSNLLSDTRSLLQVAATLRDHPLPAAVRDRLYQRLQQEGFSKDLSGEKVVRFQQKPLKS